jgi:signal transduction histidine kinase
MTVPYLLHSLFISLRRLRERTRQKIWKKPFGLKAKIAILVLINVAGVLILASYLDYRLAKKAQIDLFLDRNLYIAKQIDVTIPDQNLSSHFPRIHEEIEGWLLSRPSLIVIDVFLLTAKGWEPFVSSSKWNVPHMALSLSKDQINRLKKEKPLSSLREVDEERWLEVVVPLYSGKKVIGGIRVVSSLDEAQSYLSKKRDRTLILTLSSIVVILVTVTLLFRNLVGNPIQKLVEAMSRAEKGDLEAEAHLGRNDELGEMGRHFNQMLKTIREAHEQNIQLLSQVNRFNEELTGRIEAATSELARRNEELILLNEALFESQRQLGQSEKMAALGEVTATMAHQIGTPLNSISGYLQLMLQEGTLTSTDRNRLKIIESQLDRLTDSVKNLLSSTRQPKPLFKPLEVNDILVELIHLSEPWLHARNVKLLSALSADLPPVLGDATRLQTLFLSLISNALDAMPYGGELTIKTHTVVSISPSGNGGWVEITISDTGVGIPGESKKRIFDPFFTTKKAGEGTGLGLAICEKIIKEHSGRLSVESEVGKGSTFSIQVPALRGNEIDEPSIGPSPDRG